MKIVDASAIFFLLGDADNRMTNDHSLDSSSSHTASSMPPLPAQVKAVGYGNLIVGPLLAILNLIVVGHSISVLEQKNAPEGLSGFFVANIIIYLGVGLLLVTGGVGLLLNRRWGRIWSLVAAGSCFAALLAGSILGSVAKTMLESGALPLRSGQTSFYFQAPMSVAAFAPLYAILVIVLLMLPDARNWARGDKSFEPAGPDANAPTLTGVSAPATRTNVLAIISLVCSMVPFAMLTQIAALILGIVALTQIRKSKGAMGGKGFAIAGIVISSVLILFVAAVIIFAVVVSNSR